MTSSNSGSQNAISKDDIKTIVQLYEDDLPSLLSLDAELDLWLHHWKAEPQLASELSTPYNLQTKIFIQASIFF